MISLTKKPVRRAAAARFNADLLSQLRWYPADCRLDFRYKLLELLVVDHDRFDLKKTLRNDAGI